jgi:hypothetical protein
VGWVADTGEAALVGEVPADRVVEAMVAAAALAPSSHNTQPWRFVRSGETLRLYADRSRSLPVNDPHDRELTISCGAALFNLEVSGRHAGYRPATRLLPEPSDPDLLADVILTRAEQRADDDLARSIGRRRTTRAGFTSAPLPDDLPDRLTEVAAEHPVGWHVIAGDARADLADLVAEGDRRQFADRRWRRELARWNRPRRRRDGLAVPPGAGVATRTVIRTFDLGRRTAHGDRALVGGAPLVGVLTSGSDSPQAWLETGRALEHLLLVAAADGVYAGYLNQPCQVADLRPRLQELCASAGYPQVVLRLGHLSRSPRPSAKRTVSDVLTGSA